MNTPMVDAAATGKPNSINIKIGIIKTNTSGQVFALIDAKYIYGQ